MMYVGFYIAVANWRLECPVNVFLVDNYYATVFRGFFTLRLTTDFLFASRCFFNSVDLNANIKMTAMGISIKEVMTRLNGKRVMYRSLKRIR